jgi:PDZ domain-containing protein
MSLEGDDTLSSGDPTAEDPAPPRPEASMPVDAPADPAGEQSSRWGVWGIVAGVLGSIIGIAAIAAAFITLPYRIISPGEATPVSDIVEIHDAKTYDHRGSFLFLTVSVSNRDPSVYRYLAAWFDDDSEIVKKEIILGQGSQQQDNQLNQQLMDQSEVTAKEVALQRLGYNVPVHGDGAEIVQFTNGAPVKDHLRVGDVITEADGKTIHLADDLGPIVRSHRPGDRIALTYRRGAASHAITVTTGANAQHQAFLGVAVLTHHLQYDFPVDVHIDPGPVSGPSAGLAFTLTILQELTKADLTGGKRVAITGEIEPGGLVGEVGGVKQKAITAKHAGSVLMIVPTSEALEARRYAGSMKVVGVKTLDDALTALHAVGGAGIPPVGELHPTS